MHSHSHLNALGALEQATRRMKTVPLDSDTILTARDLGICFGD